jgi:hypothetical protein
MAMKMSTLVLWVVNFALKMETACSSKRLVTTYKTKRRHNPEDKNHISILCVVYDGAKSGGAGNWKQETRFYMYDKFFPFQ